MQPLGPVYYGEPISDQEAELELGPGARTGAFQATHVHAIEALVAKKLAEGKIVARANGTTEFGARALGNRSILARADSPVAVRTINEMVKNRDFWMPFAPSVLAERASDYYGEAQSGVASRLYMTCSAFSFEEGEKRSALAPRRNTRTMTLLLALMRSQRHIIQWPTTAH